MDKITKAFVIGACSVVIVSGGIGVAMLANSAFVPRLRCFAAHVQARVKEIFKPKYKSMPNETFKTEIRSKTVSLVTIYPLTGIVQVIKTDGGRYTVKLVPNNDTLDLLSDNNVPILVKDSDDRQSRIFLHKACVEMNLKSTISRYRWQ